MSGFEFIEHTADVGIIARGRDLKEAFANAALGMFSFIADLDTVQERESLIVEVTAADRESLLVEWLNELNFIFETRMFIFKRFEIEEIEDSHLRARGIGEPVDRQRHRIKSSVKGATYHMLRIGHNSEWHARVILDI
ncbi:MAG: archease [Chloroflexi bacterium]|nr:archease [Chloroflexota bacterium]